MSAASLFRDGLGTAGAQQLIREHMGDEGGTGPAPSGEEADVFTTEYFSLRRPPATTDAK